MTGFVDFDDVPVKLLAQGIAAGSTVTLGTVPIASASWSLAAGRVVEVSVEFLGIDSEGTALAQRLRTVLAFGQTSITDYLENAAMPNMVAVPGYGAYGPAVGSIAINGSGDLDVKWFAPGMTGVNTESVSACVKLRWLGS